MIMSENKNRQTKSKGVQYNLNCVIMGIIVGRLGKDFLFLFSYARQVLYY